MKAALFVVAVSSGLVAGAADLPVNTCVVSGSLGRNPPASGDVACSGGLDTVWRAVSSAVMATSFHPQKPAGLRMVIR